MSETNAVSDAGAEREVGAVAPIVAWVNGQEIRDEVAVRQSLADYLRDELELTATHIGCEQGICGACTVLVDGVAVRSCLMLAVQADGHEIRTVEGVAEGGPAPSGRLRAVLEQHHAFQCGFCTPGIVMSLTALIDETPPPLTREQINGCLSGHLCRCTGYQNLIHALTDADAWSAE